MTYLVMETHPAYAVVLDEAGRFLKVANRGYQSGDRVTDVIPLRAARLTPLRFAPALTAAAGLAACLCLGYFGWYRPGYTAYGTLNIRINPEVELTLSRSGRVLALEGCNPDGDTLADGYDFAGKQAETVTVELVDRAMAMGFLSDGDAVALTVESGDGDWTAGEEAALTRGLEEAYGESIVVCLGDLPEPTPEPTPPPTPAPTPTPTPTPTPAPTPAPTPPPALPDDGDGDDDDDDDDREDDDDRDDDDDGDDD